MSSLNVRAYRGSMRAEDRVPSAADSCSTSCCWKSKRVHAGSRIKRAPRNVLRTITLMARRGRIRPSTLRVGTEEGFLNQ